MSWPIDQHLAKRPVPKPSAWNSFLCWLLGHELEPITDFMTNEEIRAELERTGGRIRYWSRCARCGYKR
jgi:hypothetical protein